MAPVIVAKDLYKCYAGFSPVLRGVNIEVQAGELVAIMGPSGCGKSTMLHILGMLHAPDAGSLNILGTDVLTFTREQTAAFRRGKFRKRVDKTKKLCYHKDTRRHRTTVTSSSGLKK